jgi:hypothetical protein
MFAVTLDNQSGIPAAVKPNGDLAEGVARTVSVSGYPVPITIVGVGSGEQTHVPQSRAVRLFDGQRTYELGYEGNGTITVTLQPNSAYTASSGFGSPISGNLIPRTPRLPAVTGLAWRPPNPVYVGTVVTISWNAVPGATVYDVELLRNGNRFFNTAVNRTLMRYILQSADLYRTLTASVRARSDTALPGPRTSLAYYAGNSMG